MITGYNTDVEHDGVVYHVQTEDKGLDSPLVLSLVYSGGAILASKRSSYKDLIAAGFDEAVLTERLQRQHRLICAAINAGRIDELKKMGAPPGRAERTAEPPAREEFSAQPVGTSGSVEVAPDVAREPAEVAPKPEPLNADGHLASDITRPDPSFVPPVSAAVSDPEPASPMVSGQAGSEVPPAGKPPLETTRPVSNVPSAYTVHDARGREESARIEDGLRIDLFGAKDFRGGDVVEVQVTVIHISNQGESPVAAAVSVKILGTSFRPIILPLKTNKQGSVTVSTRIPHFNTGRAAIVIKATAGNLWSETRRVINPG